MKKAIRPLLRPDGAGSHALLGYILEGPEAGPTLVVHLPRGHASALGDALGRICRPETIRGNIVVVNIGAIGVDPEQDEWLRSQIGSNGETLYRDKCAHDGLDPRSVHETLTAIITKAADLGMISGRDKISSVSSQE